MSKSEMPATTELLPATFRMMLSFRIFWAFPGEFEPWNFSIHVPLWQEVLFEWYNSFTFEWAGSAVFLACHVHWSAGPLKWGWDLFRVCKSSLSLWRWPKLFLYLEAARQVRIQELGRDDTWPSCQFMLSQSIYYLPLDQTVNQTIQHSYMWRSILLKIHLKQRFGHRPRCIQ